MVTSGATALYDLFLWGSGRPHRPPVLSALQQALFPDAFLVYNFISLLKTGSSPNPDKMTAGGKI
jgi:hypothetical protein